MLCGQRFLFYLDDGDTNGCCSTFYAQNRPLPRFLSAGSELILPVIVLASS